MPETAAPTRRSELLAIAAGLFAERGFKNTTVRDIADAAGILSGSLYHHFDSKESMVDELLDSFQRSLWEEYDAIEASDRTPREKLEAVVRVSFDAIDRNHSEVAIFQTDAAYLAGFERFAYLKERNTRFRNLWTGLLTEGVAVRRAALGPQCRAGLPVPARHRLGGGALVPPRRRPLAGPGRRPVPAHPARRNTRRTRTTDDA